MRDYEQDHYFSIAEWTAIEKVTLSQGESTRYGLYASFLGNKRGKPFRFAWRDCPGSPTGGQKVRLHHREVLKIVFEGKYHEVMDEYRRV